MRASFLEKDCLSCPICFELYYSEDDKKAIVLECGHTLCEKCLNDNINKGREICPIDNTTKVSLDHEHLIENKVIKNFLQIIQQKIQFKMNINSLSKLSFYYCDDCDQFFSLHSIKIHKLIHHVKSVFSYSFDWFDYISQNINSSNITSIIKFFLILYYFQSPFLIKNQKLTINYSFFCNEGKYVFHGEQIERNNENKELYSILINVICDNLFSNKCILRKGILLRNNFEIIQGYFTSNSGSNEVINNGLCAFNIENLSYFGLIKFNEESKNPYGFALDMGILYDNNTFYFGTFSETVEFPKYEFNSGEIIFTENQITKVKIKKKYSEENQEEYFECLEDNKYFLIRNAGENNLRVCLRNDIIKSDPPAEVTLLMNKDFSDFQSIEINIPNNNDNSKSGNNNNNKNDINKEILENNFMITKINNDKKGGLNDLYLYDTKIFLNTNKVHLIFLNDNSNIIVSDKYNVTKDFEGYLIHFSEEKITAFGLTNLKTLISDINYFLTSMDTLLRYNLTLCHLYYQIFNPKELKRNVKENYIQIETFDNKLKCAKGETSLLIREISCDNLYDKNVQNLFPSIYTSKIFENIKNELKRFPFNRNEKEVCCKSGCRCYLF